MSKEIRKFVKFPKDVNYSKIKSFFKKKNLTKLISLSNRRCSDINDMIESNQSMTAAPPYKPELIDLYRLYQFVLLNKRTIILEFGSGFSSLIFNCALEEKKKKLSKKTCRFITVLRLYNLL
jgi:hypothetical protein